MITLATNQASLFSSLLFEMVNYHLQFRNISIGWLIAE